MVSRPVHFFLVCRDTGKTLYSFYRFQQLALGSYLLKYKHLNLDLVYKPKSIIFQLDPYNRYELRRIELMMDEVEYFEQYSTFDIHHFDKEHLGAYE